MAYGKRKARKAKSSRRTTRSTTRARKRYGLASGRVGSTRKRASRGGGTIRLELVQVPATPAISPIHQLLMDQQKVITPRKARF